MGQSSFKYAAAKDSNNLLKELRELSSVFSFKNKVLKYFLDVDVKEHNCTARLIVGTIFFLIFNIPLILLVNVFLDDYILYC